MLEIIAVGVLSGIIADMARRRGRSGVLFILLLVGGWFGGEVAGGFLGYVLSDSAAAERGGLFVYGCALVGASLGAALAFVAAQGVGRVDGIWRELPSRSRLLGMVAGGVGGVVIGAIAMIVAVLRGGGEFDGDLLMVQQGCVLAGCIGALVGLLHGVDTPNWYALSNRSSQRQREDLNRDSADSDDFCPSPSRHRAPALTQGIGAR